MLVSASSPNGADHLRKVWQMHIRISSEDKSMSLEYWHREGPAQLKYHRQRKMTVRKQEPNMSMLVESFKHSHGMASRWAGSPGRLPMKLTQPNTIK